MSIYTQKFLRFIPILNIITVFAWFRLSSCVEYRQRDYAKNLLKMFVCIIIITLFRIVLNNLFDTELINSIVFLTSVYLYFFSMSAIAVAAQEELLNK